MSALSVVPAIPLVFAISGFFDVFWVLHFAEES